MLYHLFVYVPLANAQDVKQAMFDAGGGQYEQYDQCSWESSGIGQFRPLEGAKPYIGQCDNIERVEELKIEMICQTDTIISVLKALKMSHPYEEPAYGVIEIKMLEDF